MMRILAFTLLLATMGFAAEPLSGLPLPESPTCADLARVANRFIALGEVQAVKELKQLCDASTKDVGLEFRMMEQVGWICRLIFVAEDSRPLRAPRFGGLSLPWNTMKAEDWPLYPLAESKGVFFILAQGYMLAGTPEDPRRYIDYCRTTGKFRTKALAIPSVDEASRTLDLILSSSAWKSIKWNDSRWNSSSGGFSYEMDESIVVTYLKKQTEDRSNQALQHNDHG